MDHPGIAVLDTILPGFSLWWRLFSSHFPLGISVYILFILMTVTAITFQFRRYITDYLFSTVEIRYDDELYKAVRLWISKQPFVRRERHVIAQAEQRDDMPWYSLNNNDDNDADEVEPKDGDTFWKYWSRRIESDKLKDITYLPGVIVSFTYKGYTVSFKRVPCASDGSIPWLMDADKIVLSSRNSAILKELLNDVRQNYVQRDTNRTIIYHPGNKTHGTWDRQTSISPRPLSTVIMDHTEKKKLVADITEYLGKTSQSWYNERGIPYRRGYLFWGPPGTGKTSLVLALAGKFGLNIYKVDLSLKNLEHGKLDELFRRLPPRCIVLIEDVDCSGISYQRGGSSTVKEDEKNPVDKIKSPHKRDDKNSNEGISLSTLLNVTDGVGAPQGRILIMTTNHREVLDKALIRAGRVDVEIGFGYADSTEVKTLFSSFYTASCSSNTTIMDLGAQLAEKIAQHRLTIAELQGYLLQNRNSPGAAVENIGSWLQKHVGESQ